MDKTKASKLPRTGTISRSVIDNWRAAGSIRFNEALDLYCDHSPTYFRAKDNFRARAGMNLTRLLKRFGTKEGKAGGRGMWIYDGPGTPEHQDKGDGFTHSNPAPRCRCNTVKLPAAMIDGDFNVVFKIGDIISFNRGAGWQEGMIKYSGGRAYVAFGPDNSCSVDLTLIKKDCDLQPGGWRCNMRLDVRPTMTNTATLVTHDRDGTYDELLTRIDAIRDEVKKRDQVLAREIANEKNRITNVSVKIKQIAAGLESWAKNLRDGNHGPGAAYLESLATSLRETVTK